jgi:hypothetical protein
MASGRRASRTAHGIRGDANLAPYRAVGRRTWEELMPRTGDCASKLKLSVFGVCAIPATSRIPLRPLITAGREASVVLEHACAVH